eukprot:CAMPEP_0197034248 /NCGR_PEP_ID=MMETSP1384-20130603/12413_1 /TAXON_ID=29189 /ORGANISM="Ammonia sp." /LENGTH=383 /DNA_ID=CAMNT_0042464151 /DNA_START=31 /DNA_END=1182 /DNA_ORIENTATION=-
MNTSVDYQLEAHLKEFEDELIAAEQKYVETLQSIVGKYITRAAQLREQSVKEYQEHVKQSNSSNPPASSPPITAATQSSHSNLVDVNDEPDQKADEIVIDSPIQSSGYTPNYIKKIRQSLQRGQALYEQTRDQDLNDKENSNQADKDRANNNVHLAASNCNEHVADLEEDDDDDLDHIISMPAWTKQLRPDVIQPSNDSSFVSTSPVRIHQSEHNALSCAGSEHLSPSRCILRESHVAANTLKYGQSSSKYQSKLMVNRLRRKRKYAHSMSTHFDPDDLVDEHELEPPKKKSNVHTLDLMSSRDLKNEIKRIHTDTHKENVSLTRKNLLKKSVQRLSAITSQNETTPNRNAINSRKRIQSVIKDIFNSETESDDDDLRVTRRK